MIKLLNINNNMPTEVQSNNIKPQKRHSWEVMLIFVILIIGLVIIFPHSEFVSFSVLFSPIVLFLLFAVKTVSKPNSADISPFKKAVTIAGIVGAQCIGLFLGVVSLIPVSDNRANSTERSLSFFGLFFTIIFPLIIWAIYYLYKKKNSLTLITITSIPMIIALLLLLQLLAL